MVERSIDSFRVQQLAVDRLHVAKHGIPCFTGVAVLRGTRDGPRSPAYVPMRMEFQRDASMLGEADRSTVLGAWLKSPLLVFFVLLFYPAFSTLKLTYWQTF